MTMTLLFLTAFKDLNSVLSKNNEDNLSLLPGIIDPARIISGSELRISSFVTLLYLLNLLLKTFVPPIYCIR